MEQKKETNGQLQRRIKNAVLHIDRTKDTQSIFFDDKGVRLTVTEDKAIIATGYHRHVFESFTMSGVSRPFNYTKFILEIAKENDCEVTDNNGNVTGHSYAKLLDTLKAKEDKHEYNIAYYYEWWMTNIFSPLYAIGESDVETFMTYFDYCCNVARNAVLLSEKKEDMTNKQFVEEFIKNLKDFTDSMSESVLLHKKSDEDVMIENIEAVAEMELNEQMQDNGSKD